MHEEGAAGAGWAELLARMAMHLQQTGWTVLVSRMRRASPAGRACGSRDTSCPTYPPPPTPEGLRAWISLRGQGEAKRVAGGVSIICPPLRRRRRGAWASGAMADLSTPSASLAPPGVNKCAWSGKVRRLPRAVSITCPCCGGGYSPQLSLLRALPSDSFASPGVDKSAWAGAARGRPGCFHHLSLSRGRRLRRQLSLLPALRPDALAFPGGEKPAWARKVRRPFGFASIAGPRPGVGWCIPPFLPAPSLRLAARSGAESSDRDGPASFPPRAVVVGRAGC